MEGVTEVLPVMDSLAVSEGENELITEGVEVWDAVWDAETHTVRVIETVTEVLGEDEGVIEVERVDIKLVGIGERLTVKEEVTEVLPVID